MRTRVCRNRQRCILTPANCTRLSRRTTIQTITELRLRAVIDTLTVGKYRELCCLERKSTLCMYSGLRLTGEHGVVGDTTTTTMLTSLRLGEAGYTAIELGSS